VNLAAHTSHGDVNFEQWLNGLKAVFLSQGYDAATAAQKALALAYQTVQAQANTLSFESSFWIMAVIISCLAPLPFIMRRPKPGERQPSLH
jgi:DHA2 family multidrug resistance protein